MTREGLAAQSGYKAASVKAFEYGHRTPTPAIAADLDRIFDTKGLFVAVQRDAEQETTAFAELREVEQRATIIRIWDLRVIPGLLRTEECASAILTDQEAVGRRLKRQEVFAREDPPRVSVIICESVFYQEIGGAGRSKTKVPRRSSTARWAGASSTRRAGWPRYGHAGISSRPLQCRRTDLVR